MGFLVSLPLHPLLDFLRGGLVGFVRCKQGPKHPLLPLGQGAWVAQNPQPCSALSWSCLPHLPSVASKNQGMVHD